MCHTCDSGDGPCSAETSAMTDGASSSCSSLNVEVLACACSSMSRQCATYNARQRNRQRATYDVHECKPTPRSHRCDMSNATHKIHLRGRQALVKLASDPMVSARPSRPQFQGKPHARRGRAGQGRAGDGKARRVARRVARRMAGNGRAGQACCTDQSRHCASAGKSRKLLRCSRVALALLHGWYFVRFIGAVLPAALLCAALIACCALRGACYRLARTCSAGAASGNVRRMAVVSSSSCAAVGHAEAPSGTDQRAREQET